LIDFEKKTLQVERTKSGKPLTLPINSDLYDELKRLRALDETSPYVFLNRKTGKPLATVRKPFTAACEKAEFTGLTFHRLRHTVASRLIERNADIEEVRSLLGHSSIAVTQRYVHATDDRRRAAVELLSKWAPGRTPIRGKSVSQL
jgi:integrase